MAIGGCFSADCDSDPADGVRLPVVEIPLHIRVQALERRANELESAVLLVGGELGIVALEVAAIAGREVVFRVDPVGFCGLVDVLGGAETVVDDDGFADFLLGDAVNGFGSSVVI